MRGVYPPRGFGSLGVFGAGLFAFTIGFDGFRFMEPFARFSIPIRFSNVTSSNRKARDLSSRSITIDRKSDERRSCSALSCERPFENDDFVSFS